MKVAVVNCLNDSNDTAGCELTKHRFEKFLPGFVLEQYFPSSVPSSLDKSCAGVIVTGSPTKAFATTEWVELLKQWVGDQLVIGTRVLGICFGSQIVALAAFGKDAECVSISPEIGCRVVRSKLDVIGDVCVVQTHAEIIKVPKESIVFENEVGCQGFCWGSAMGVQFHPEYNLEDGRVRAALRKDAGEVTLEYFNDALDSLQDGRRNDGPLVWDRLIVPWLQGKLQIK